MKILSESLKLPIAFKQIAQCDDYSTDMNEEESDETLNQKVKRND